MILLLLLAADPIELARQCGEAMNANRARMSQYAYSRRTEIRYKDKLGKETASWTETREVIGLEGSTYERLMQINEQPLDAKAEKREQMRQRKEETIRRNEAPEQRRLRLNGLRAFYTFEIPYSRLSEVFRLTYKGEEQVEGLQTEILTAEANPSFQPRDVHEQEWRVYRVQLWLDPASGIPVREEIVLTGDLPHLQQGSRVWTTRGRLPDGTWAPYTFVGELIKIADHKFVSHLSQRDTFSRFHQFQTDSKFVGDKQE